MLILSLNLVLVISELFFYEHEILNNAYSSIKFILYCLTKVIKLTFQFIYFLFINLSKFKFVLNCLSKTVDFIIFSSLHISKYLIFFVKNYSQNPKHNSKYRGPFLRKYTVKNGEQLEALNKWLINNIENPIPDRETKKSLSLQTGLTERQISLWFNYQNNKMKEY